MDKILLGKSSVVSEQKAEAEDGKGVIQKDKAKKRGALLPVPPEIAGEVTCDV